MIGPLNRERRVATHPPMEITSFGDEVDPRSVGLTQADIDAIWEAVVRYYEVGFQPSIAVCIRRRGQIVLHRTIGHRHGNAPGEITTAQLATTETRFNMFSGSKAVLGTLMGMIQERGHVRLDDRVVRYIPEFGRHGKSNITLRHLLSHQAGIPVTPPHAVKLDVLHDPEALLELCCDQVPTDPPGRRVAYHAITAGFVLQEVAKKVTGHDVRGLLDEWIRKPLGLRTLTYGVPDHELDQVARDVITGPTAPAFFNRLLSRSLGAEFEDVVAMASEDRFLTGVVPSGNVIGTSDDVGRFFEMLLRGGELDGVRVMQPKTVAQIVRPHNSGRRPDGIIKLPIRYGLGFMLGGRRVSFYGDHSRAAFGHLGFTNVLAWADPERDISVAFLNNGKPFIALELLLWLRIPRIIASRVPRDHRNPIQDWT